MEVDLIEPFFRGHICLEGISPESGKDTETKRASGSPPFPLRVPHFDHRRTGYLAMRQRVRSLWPGFFNLAILI